MPRFSIVIPTRDRPDTLEHCLRTCLTSYPFDVEVVVFDNSHFQGTKSVVQKLGCVHGNTEIVYVESGVDLAMSKSWEAAVDSARGDYVTVIGDDDGLIPGGLLLAEDVLRRYPLDLARFAQASYGWPGNPVEEWRDRIGLPLNQCLKVLSGNWMVEQVAGFQYPYRYLPMIYNSLVHRDFLGRIRDISGELFSATSPDVESGFLFAGCSGKYLNCSVPVTIAGGSHRSNGISELVEKRRFANAELFGSSGDYWVLNESQGIKWPEILPKIRALPLGVAEALLKANKRLTGRESLEPMEAATLICQCIKFMRKFPSPNHEQEFDQLRSFAVQQKVEFDSLDTPTSGLVQKDTELPYSPLTHQLNLSVDGLGIENVFDAATFMARFFDYSSICRSLKLQGRGQTLWAGVKGAVAKAIFLKRPRRWEIGS